MKTVIISCLVVTIIVLIAQLIGPIELAIGIGNAKITLLPMLFSILIGILITTPMMQRIFTPVKRVFNQETQQFSVKMVGVFLLLLGTKYAGMIIPNIPLILSSGPILLLEEIGNLFPVIIALPIAIKLGMKRQAIGAATSIDREPSVAVINAKYGINSQEGIGVLGVYLCGSILGTIWFSILGSLAPLTGLHPLALGAGAGVGSASMLAAASASIVNGLDPVLAQKVLAISAASNFLTSALGSITLTFLWLPLANLVYRIMNKPTQANLSSHKKVG